MRFLIGGRVRFLVLLAVMVAAVAALPAGATVSATNGKIAFGFGDVFTINPDGTQVHQLGVPRSTGCTSWSPDSSKILCNVFSENGPQPATANPDGSDFTFLNQDLPLDLFCLNWSPDGSRLLCHSEGIPNPADAGLYTVRSSDAGDLVRVTTTLPGGFDDGYGYSPDGSRILYAQFANGHGTLFSVKPDGSDPVQLSPPGLSIIDLDFFDQVGADWSPDSSRVTFAASKSGHVSALFVVNADGTGLSGRDRAQTGHDPGLGRRRCSLLDPGLVTRQHQAPPQQTRPQRPQRRDVLVDREHRRLPVSEADGHGGPDGLCLGQCAA